MILFAPANRFAFECTTTTPLSTARPKSPKSAVEETMNKKPPDQNQAGRMQHSDQLWTRGGRQCLDIAIIPAYCSPITTLRSG